MDQLAILVRFWLRQDPVDDLDEFVAQASRAKWLEDRMWQTFAEIMSKVMGGK